MEWLNNILQPGTLVLLIPIVAIVGGFVVAALKSHHRHLERIEKIKRGIEID